MRYFFLLLLLVSVASVPSYAQQLVVTSWGMSPTQVRAQLARDPTFHLLSEKTKDNLRLLTYTTSQPSVRETYCFEGEQLTTIRIDRDITQVLAPVPQGKSSATELDTWRDETGDVLTQRRYEDGLLSDFLLSNKAHPAK